MIAFVVLILAALSRFVPHSMFHAVGINFTAVGAGLLFFGARSPRWQAAIAAAVLAVTDVLLTHFVYAFPFHVSSYLVTWAWYAAVCLIGAALLRKVTVLRVIAGVLASATSFFIVSNFVVWTSGMYGHTLSGLATCYAAAVPFYANDLISTGLISATLFGLPVLAKNLVDMMETNRKTAQITTRH
jgi:hypothetical protein